jgi:hypothetical protein
MLVVWLHVYFYIPFVQYCIVGVSAGVMMSQGGGGGGCVVTFYTASALPCQPPYNTSDMFASASECHYESSCGTVGYGA